MTPPPASFLEALRFWAKLGCINFGGPAGQIAIMHRELVERRGWVTEGQFLRALNFCMILPGPEAQQLATYIGWRLHGTPGGLAAGSLFVLPSVFVLLLLSWLAAAHADVPAIAGLLYGVQPVVMAIVAEAVLRIGRRTLHHWSLVGFAASAFIAIRFFSVPFPIIIAAAALAGVAVQRRWPRPLRPRGQDASPRGADPAGPTAPNAAGTPSRRAPSKSFPPLRRAARIGAVFFVLWAAPVLGLLMARGGADVLVRQALFFTQAAFVTFGGAYAVLAYIADMAVNR
ncbi:MAG: chromate transporter, partial [Acidobacteria bacterium]|nr:chromate transporter [Acidobacteriota bacterium]